MRQQAGQTGAQAQAQVETMTETETETNSSPLDPAETAVEPGEVDTLLSSLALLSV